ncbi:SGNH/GDSL hydrolase family protein [Cyclobacterium jeungdonense]|uniref:SGNH/GDSL hydrolase family protein n=1 Tax=Cyclobacterium jeungdonense TaxID=708087 RepID=A0ABT8C832_9BACT|nr:SGNH/GDSL hydrolase family protein [Cyclobacterium jeungdonense]MDN3687978.1 SGNH/GDSL hydrolase family protein [Cyclobacterium jeungdonense]
MIARAIVCFACYFLTFPLPAQSSYSIPNDSKKILFLGNSISYAGHYLTYVETYLRLMHPERNWEFINLGLPSETVSGLSEEGHASGRFPRPDLHERLDRVLKAVEPDFIFSCYGMNDGIYLPFDESRFSAYKKGQGKLQQKADALGIPLVHLTPPVYDRAQDPAYAAVLSVYASWMVSQRYTQDWKVIDLYWPMRKFLEDRRESNPAFALTTDGIHPGEQGHWLMARSLLKGIGESQHLEADLHKEVFDSIPLGAELLPLVREKQELTRDAWLTFTGHERPGLREGLPMDQALSKKDELMQAISTLLSTGKIR